MYTVTTTIIMQNTRLERVEVEDGSSSFFFFFSFFCTLDAFKPTKSELVVHGRQFATISVPLVF